MNLGAVLVTGLFAGGVSCAAVQGGLLAGLVTRQRDQAPAAAGARPGGEAGKVGNPATDGQQPQDLAATATSRAAWRPKAKQRRPKAEQSKRASRRARDTAPPPSLRRRLADDFAPVGGFLAGKLVSHTLLGAALGALGAAVQISPGMRALAQLLAGALVITMGLSQLGVRGFRRVVIAPPASWSRFVRGRARSSAALAPTLLGLATILVPCGVTLSVEALALASGSPWAGAATMAVFVAGTSPLFAVLGYAARKAATAWQGRLATATGLIVLALGLYTLNGGLTLIGSPLAANRLVQTLGLSAPPATVDTVTTDSGTQSAVVTATTGSYSPANVQVKAGAPTTLIVRSHDATGCIRAFVIRDKQYILPENGDTRIDLGVLQPGTLDYACGMGMYTGQLTIVP